ncbi:MAG: S9 family peptidase [Alphaproteobacteria bacterium]|nr:S9 family peptidase [Alphaproteobacteria bacterium]
MRFAVAGLAVAGLAGPALAEAPSVRDLARTVGLSSPAVSPDGKLVAFVERRADLDDDVFKTEIWLVDLATKTVRPFTQGRDHAGAPAWSPDGASLAFEAPDKDHHLQVFVASMSGGDARQVTHAKDSVSQFAWRPDGKAIAYVVTDEAPERKGEAKYDKLFRVGHDDFTQTEAPRPAHIWLIDLAGGEARRLTHGTWSLPVSLPPGPPSSPLQWTRDGASILFVRQETPSTGDGFLTRIEVLDVASGAIRDLTGAKTLEGYPLLSPDGKTVFYWRNRDGEPWTFQDVWAAPFAGGAGKDLSATTVDKNIYGTQWARDGQSLLVGGDAETTVGLWRMTPDGKATRLDLGDLTPANGFWMSYDQLPDGRIVTVAATPEHPPELYLLDKDGGHPTALTHVNAFADSLTLARTETVTWKAPRGRTLDGVLTYPAGYTAGTKAPLVLYIHGGPNSSSRRQFNLVPQVMAAKGYMVFEPNYRGSDNLDGAFFASIYKDAGQGPGEDVMAGVRMLQDKGLVDPARMAVTGWSYGGFMTVWLAGHYPVWKAAVAGAAVTDWREMYDISDGNVTITEQSGISPYVPDGWAANWAQSPANSQTKITAPTLIMSDTGDFRVPIPQSFSLYRALEDNHVETQFYAIPTGGHFPSDPVQMMAVFDKWVGWVETHIKS